VTGRIGRRGLVLAGLTGVAGACAPHDAQPPRDTPAPPVSPDGLASSAGGGRGPSAADWRQLARSVSGSLARPGSTTYDTVRLTQNPRYDGARPLAVLSVARPGDVATALAFAQDHGLPIAIRSGGHSYPGWSAGDGRLVIDLRPLHRVSLDGAIATIGAGASLIQVYDVLGTQGRGVAGGSCPTVGIGGLTQGGGVGVLARAHGLTCDAVTRMRVVLADGRVVTASADHEPDLFWALRGGGGGHLGVVTSFTMSTFATPTITRAFLAWPFAAAHHVVPHWLATAPTADRRLWSTLKLLGGASHPGGPALVMSATWTGSPAAMDTALGPFLSGVPTPPTDSRHTDSYRDTMLAYAGCSTIPVGSCHTGPGGSLERERFAATSHVVKADHVDMAALLSRVHAAQGSGVKEAGISLDSLGGAVDDLGTDATAFGHRGALATVQYTATYDAGPATPALSYVRAFRGAMTPSWGHGAYVNYADAALANYQRAYFGSNAARLADARATYDPHHVFTQPQDY
jgi:FAD/FMN-containing dehydrogenase